MMAKLEIRLESYPVKAVTQAAYMLLAGVLTVNK